MRSASHPSILPPRHGLVVVKAHGEFVRRKHQDTDDFTSG